MLIIDNYLSVDTLMLTIENRYILCSLVNFQWCSKFRYIPFHKT